MRRLLRAPALHFLALGALLLAASRAWERPAVPAAGATVSDDELLYQEALALGADRRDPAVRARLARIGGFVDEERRGEAALEDEARRLGLERSDLVVRRHLIDMMRLAAGRLDARDAPSEDEVAAYLAAHAGDFGVPGMLRLTHVYLARDRHGAALAADAATVLASLRAEAVAPAAAPARGDAFVDGSEVGPASAADLDRRFGPGFAASLADAPVGTWVGPVRSSYGLHLVFIESRTPATVPALASVRSQVIHRMLRERSEARARERIAALRTRAGL